MTSTNESDVKWFDIFSGPVNNTETLWWAGPLRSLDMTRVLHAARISNVDSGMFLNGIRKKVNFELRKRYREMFFVLSRAWKKDDKTKEKEKKNPDSYQWDRGSGKVYKCYVKKQTKKREMWGRKYCGKLNTMMARQEETKDRGKFSMKLHLASLISDQK